MGDQADLVSAFAMMRDQWFDFIKDIGAFGDQTCWQ
jgi:hypothetical protein